MKLLEKVLFNALNKKHEMNKETIAENENGTVEIAEMIAELESAVVELANVVGGER